MLSPSNTTAAHHKGTARVAAISGRCCFAAPMNLIVTVNNHTAMIDEVLTQSPMPVTIITTRQVWIYCHMATNQPEEDAEQWCHRSLVSRVEEVPQDMQFLSHPCVGDTQGYDIDTQELWMLCRKP